MKGLRFNLILVILLVSGLGGCRNNLELYLPILNDIPPVTEAEEPVNIILFIGDGMGLAQIRAAGLWKFGDNYRDSDANSFSFENFPVQVLMRTPNAWGGITDSAASATAMATGSKVNNGVLSLEIPGSGGELETLGEMAKIDGKAVGLVTTDNILSATPAAFAVHQLSRNQYDRIAPQMLTFKANLLFGGGKSLSADDALGAGYTVVEDYTIWDTALPEDLAYPFHVYGRFGDDIFPYISEDTSGYPALDEMTEKALDLLENNANGFFLLIENELTDEASHLNDIGKLVEEVDALHQAVDTAIQWADTRATADTLIIVTADHETGGLSVLSNNGAGNLPGISWSTNGHTSTNVRFFAYGKNSDDFNLVLENMDIYRLISRYYQ